MVLMRLISLYMLTAFGLAFIVNYVPGLMLPIYILAMIGLFFCSVIFRSIIFSESDTCCLMRSR
ncbi:hypothetical protein [Bacillus pumilus]|uniref:hypothetical protein n=1 Tax=Bacillus pumilus TaxID=1408 RepID=UPI00211372F8|nr:hypothetical protein [Bacillus pumilus]UUD41513.1 hypothetical protein NPA43_11690 [Bacillus pumilus]